MNQNLTPEALKALTMPQEPVLFAEYRAGSIQSNNYQDKNGRRRVLNRATHQIEIGSSALAFEELLPDELDTTKWVAPAVKGSPVLVALEFTRATTPGTWRIRVKSVRSAVGANVK